MKKEQVSLLSKEIIIKSRDIFREHFAGLILYGSYARGDYDEGSDIDYMLLVDLPQEKQIKYRPLINELASTLSLEHDITVSIKIKDVKFVERYKENIPFYYNVLKEGVLISA